MPHPLKSHFSRRFHIYRDITHSGADFRAMRNHTFHAFTPCYRRFRRARTAPLRHTLDIVSSRPLASSELLLTSRAIASVCLPSEDGLLVNLIILAPS